MTRCELKVETFTSRNQSVLSRTFSNRDQSKTHDVFSTHLRLSASLCWCQNSTPAPLCQYQFDGYIEIGCGGFHRCNSHQLETVTCPDDKVMELDSLTCVPVGTGHTDCGKPEMCDPAKGDGHFADYTSGCQSYYRCYLNRFICHFYCPKNTFFRRDQERCDYRSNMPANEAAKCFPTVG